MPTSAATKIIELVQPIDPKDMFFSASWTENFAVTTRSPSTPIIAEVPTTMVSEVLAQAKRRTPPV